MGDMLNPSAMLLCKLASIAVHAEEYLSPGGHQFDRDALAVLLSDPEVSAWIGQMTAAAMAPRKREADNAG